MRLHHLAFRCRDLPRQRAFYEDVLGLAVVREQPGYSVWFALSDAVLMLEQADPGETTVADNEPGLDCVVWADDVMPHGWEERLQAAGVTFEAATKFTRYFRDPEGRRLAVSTYGLPELSGFSQLA